jgi:hypothetical protein
MRTPDPAEIICVSPLAIGGQFFRPPNVLVVILRVVTKLLRQVTLAIVYPRVKWIGTSGGVEFPIARVLAVYHEFG